MSRTGIVAVLPGKFLKSLRNHTSHQVGGLFGGTLMAGLITEPLGFVQDAQDVMVLFDEWLAVLGLSLELELLPFYLASF